MADADYTFWQDALAGKDMSKRTHMNDPQPGFYRTKRGDAVAIWYDSGKIVAKENARMVDAEDVWSWCCTAPVTHEAYTHRMEQGAWPDGAPPNPATIGHNMPDDPAEALALELAGERELAEAFLKKPIQSEDDADKAAVWSKRLGNISKKADDHRKVEKQPHIDAGAAVDAKWNPIRDGAKEISTALKRHLDGWLRQKQAEEAERQRKAREEAEAKRRAAEEAARKASAEDEAAKAEAERLAKEAAAAEKEAAQNHNASAGRTGAKVAMRTFTFAEITDYDALLTALKDRDEVKELVQSLANRAAKSGIELPGMKIIQEQRAA